MSDKITLELSIATVQALADGAGYEAEVMKAARQALAEYNPLGLPWRSAKNPQSGWSVLDCKGQVHFDCLTKAQADLIAAAGDCADALEKCVEEGSMASASVMISALEKAGRR